MAATPERIRIRWRDRKGRGVLAVSGGADSVAMLRAMAEWYPGSDLIVAHLNHRLRGEQSDEDARFVATLAESLGVEYRTVAVDVLSLAEANGANLEDAARRTRYDWLTALAVENRASWIATGHTADDQAETLLHRLLRGSGLQGLRGIAHEREVAPGIELVRPLLFIARAELVEYLHSLPQSWREDESNRDPRYTRNRIRHELLPLLETFNPAVRALLGRLAEQASEAHDEQEALGRSLLAQAELPRAGAVVVLDAETLRHAPRQRVRTMFRVIWEREAWPRDDMTFEHWNRLADDVAAGKTASDFPGGVKLGTRKGIVRLRRD